ncbi:MAG: hypothetical protein AAFQ89_05850 [Cyanobacteria bacterium J06626_18]
MRESIKIMRQAIAQIPV